MMLAVVTRSEKTHLVVEVCRHGARASEVIYPFTVDHPNDNFEKPFDLTQQGAE
jgi:hypothetical protein